ncbi:MAG: hypothetical protein QXI91_00920 [Candidatus Bathyarchaeia archaeon]
MFETLEILVFTSWTLLISYATWYFTSAKHYAPLTKNEAEILWKIHKQNGNCNGKKWQAITRHGKMIGFKCECGYKHTQKRPIIANTPAPTHPQTTILE